jgi:starch synthase
MARQRICFISAEISPFAKTGGLGDVTGALTRQLHRRGHDVRVFVPLHGLMEFQGAPLRHVESLQELTVVVGSQLFQYDVAAAPLPGAEGFEIFLIDCPALFDRPYIYSDAPDEHVRYLLLTRAALDCCQRMQFAPDIVHCNDWHTAFAPLLLKTAYAWDRDVFGRTRSVFTIHNIA